nr:hypothetical protein [Tanacetum cinerariifolium]
MINLFGTIPTTIPNTTPFVIPPSTHIDTALTPTSPDYTPASPDYSSTSDMEFDPSEDPSSYHIPPLPATSPFLSSTDDSAGKVTYNIWCTLTSSYDSYTGTAYPSWSTVPLPSQWAGMHDDREEEGWTATYSCLA